MPNDKIRSVLNGIEFRPTKAIAVPFGRDRFNRRQFMPVIEGTLSGSPCKIVPVDLGLYSSERDAVNDAENWAECL